jgi:hypothetical protein
MRPCSLHIALQTLQSINEEKINMGEGGGGRYKKYIQLHGCKYMFGMNKQAREMIIGADLLENTLT